MKLWTERPGGGRRAGGSPSKKAVASGVMGIGEPQGRICSEKKVRKWPSVCRVAGSQAGTENLQGDKY